MNDIQKSFTGDLSSDKIDAELEQELAAAMGDQTVEQMMQQAINSEPSKPEAEASDDDAASEQTLKSNASDPVSMQMQRGRITSVQGDDVFVNLHGMDQHLQGVVPTAQFEHPPRPGSIMDFVIQRIDEAEGLVLLSREGVVGKAAWDQLRRGAVIEARVTRSNKGGLELEVTGKIKAFMPASQIDMHHVDDMDSYIGQKLTVMVHDMDQRGSKLVVSRRKYLEHQRKRLARKAWETLEVGQSVEGKVARLMPYGAFVDIGGIDGLLHVADMSYSRINHPDEVVKVGEAVTVKILSMDPETKKVRLGLKQAQPDPWESLSSRLNVGYQLTVTVTRLADFGAFVQIEPGLEALLPLSEMSWSRRDKTSDLVSEGQAVRVAILSIDSEKRRMSVSLKQEQGDPWTGAEVKFPRNGLVDATVQSITDFGAFVQVEPGVEGLVHISELSTKRINNVEDVLTVGDKMQFRVLECDEENRKIRLSLKAVDHLPTEQASTSTPVKRALPKFKGTLKGGIE